MSLEGGRRTGGGRWQLVRPAFDLKDDLKTCAHYFLLHRKVEKNEVSSFGEDGGIWENRWKKNTLAS